MKTPSKLRWAVGVAPVLLAGCALGPNRAAPAVDVPAAWKEGGASAAAAPAFASAWWDAFADAELDAIEGQVLDANPDLQRAMARVAEARALAGLSSAALSPQLSAGGGHVRQRLSANREGAAGAAAEFEEHRTGVDLSYEIDLWKRHRRATEAAGADAQAVAYDFAAVRLTLTADAARHYFQLRALDAERRVLTATLALRRDAAHLQATRQQAGLINEVDVTRARTEVANVEAELHALARGRAQLEHALAVLCGQAPAAFRVAETQATGLPPAVPAGLPSSLLQRRPDIAAAERQIAAAAARIAVAKADFFPRLTLTGSAGLASADLGSLLEGDSRQWSFGPSLYLPLLDGGRNRAALEAAEARFDGASAAYRAVVLRAFQDVEDALSDLGALAAQGDAVDRALASARDTAALAAQRYEKGLSSYLEVVDAQRGALQSERLAAQLRGQRAVTTVQLVKALGGGWKQPGPARLASVGGR